VSPEFLVASLIYAAYLMNFGIFAVLGHQIKADGDVWKYLPTLTIALAAYSFSLSSKLRAPLQGKANRDLYQWPMYQYLVDRVYISMMYSIASVLGSLGLWVFGKISSDGLVGLIFLCATSISAATALLMLLAHQKIIEILTRVG
jgi:hypothetical protein